MSRTFQVILENIKFAFICHVSYFILLFYNSPKDVIYSLKSRAQTNLDKIITIFKNRFYLFTTRDIEHLWVPINVFWLIDIRVTITVTSLNLKYMPFLVDFFFSDLSNPLLSWFISVVTFNVNKKINCDNFVTNQHCVIIMDTYKYCLFQTGY